MKFYDLTAENQELLVENTNDIPMEDGFLTVEVISGRDDTPIPRATVMIYSEENGLIMQRVLLTGINGKTETVALSAPAKRFSLMEISVIIPYSRYTIRIESQGYYTNVYRNAQVFADTLSIQTSRMTPLPFGVRGGPEIEKIFDIPERPIR